jgi:uncharacterized membrane protein
VIVVCFTLAVLFFLMLFFLALMLLALMIVVEVALEALSAVFMGGALSSSFATVIAGTQGEQGREGQQVCCLHDFVLFKAVEFYSTSVLKVTWMSFAPPMALKPSAATSSARPSTLTA